MSDCCLTAEELKLLNERNLRGAGLFRVLQHLENCEQCRSQVKLPTKEELLKRLGIDELPSTSSSSSSAATSKK